MTTLTAWARADLAAALGVIADAVGGPGAAGLRAPGLVNDPGALADALAAAVTGGGDAALSALAEAGPDLAPVPPVTASRRAQASAQVLIVTLVRELAGIEVARRAAAQESVRADAQARLERALAILDGLGGSADVELWVALEDLRVALIDRYAAVTPHLPGLRTTEQLAGLPSLVGAYRLTGRLDAEADLVARNIVQRPGFLPAGALEMVDA